MILPKVFLWATLSAGLSAAVENAAGYRYLGNEAHLATEGLYGKLVKGKYGEQLSAQESEKAKNMGVTGHLFQAAKNHHNAFQAQGGLFGTPKPIIPPQQQVISNSHYHNFGLVGPKPDMEADKQKYGSFRDKYWGMDNSKDAHKKLAWRKFKGKFKMGSSKKNGNQNAAGGTSTPSAT